MYGMNDYSEDDKRFYESLGLLVAKEITAEKAAEISGYSFTTYMELLRKRKIFPYIYSEEDFQTDLKNLEPLAAS